MASDQAAVYNIISVNVNILLVIVIILAIVISRLWGCKRRKNTANSPPTFSIFCSKSVLYFLCRANGNTKRKRCQSYIEGIFFDLDLGCLKRVEI